MVGLTGPEQKQVRHYYTMARLAQPCLIMMLVVPILWGILAAADKFLFNARQFYTLGLVLMLIIEGILLTTLICSIVIPIQGVKKRSWTAIERKLPRLHQAGDNKALILAYLSQPLDMRIRTIAEDMHVSVLSSSVWGWIAVIVPILSIAAMFVPELMHSNDILNQRIADITGSQQQLARSFEKIDYTAQYDLPTRNIQENYYITLRADKDTDGSYAYIELNDEGIITEVDYHILVNEEQPIKNTVNNFNRKIAQAAKAVKDSDAPVKNSVLTDCTGISPALMKKLENISLINNQIVSESSDSSILTLFYRVENVNTPVPPYLYFTVVAR